MRDHKAPCLALLCIALSTVLTQARVLAQQQHVVKRKCAILREGPGSFYPAVAELPQGTAFDVLAEEGRWYRITVDPLTGYVSVKVIRGKAEREDVFPDMARFRAEIGASQVVMSAGVKGFGEKYSKKLQGDSTFVAYCFAYQIDPAEYQRFRKETYRGMSVSRVRDAIPLDPYEGPTSFTFSQEGIGLAIASKIAAAGLYQNTAAQDYVNYVGNLVVAACDAYEISFKFFILDIPHINAYSCPGGIVFVTKGMLKKLASEAELACVLGHEIAHVARRHGMKELEERRMEAVARDAFDELQMSDQMAKVDEELADLAQSIYDRIFAGRLGEYEQEADQLGLTFAARAGYVPSALGRLLDRIAAGDETSNNEHYAKDQIATRKKQVAAYLEDQDWPDRPLVNTDRLRGNFVTLE